MSQHYNETIFHFLSSRYESLTAEKVELSKSKKTVDTSILDAKIQCIANIRKYVKSGIFTNSKCDKFVCQNCDLSRKEMAEKWNTLALGDSTLKKKSESTFRCQISVLSNKIYFLLGYSASELDDLLSRDTEEGIKELVRLSDNCISLMEINDIDISVDFNFSIEAILREHEIVKNYSVDECKSEIEFLKMVSRNNLERLMSEQNKDKLAYILCRMRAPLYLEEQMSTATYKLKDPDSYLGYKEMERNVYAKKINDMKLEINKSLYSSGIASLGFVEPEVVNMAYIDDDEVVLPNESVKSKSKWGIQLSKTAEQMFQDAWNRYQSLTPEQRNEYVSQVSDHSLEIEACKSQFFSFDNYTPLEQIKVFIDTQNPFILCMVLDELDVDKSSGSKQMKEQTSEDRLALNDIDEVRISDYKSVLPFPELLFDTLNEYVRDYAPKYTDVDESNLGKCKEFLRGYTRKGILKQLVSLKLSEKEIKTVLQSLVDKSNGKGE